MNSLQSQISFFLPLKTFLESRVFKGWCFMLLNLSALWALNVNHVRCIWTLFIFHPLSLKFVDRLLPDPSLEEPV